MCWLRLATALLLFAAAGCVAPYAVPEPLYRQVAHGVSLAQLRQGADQYRGTSVMFGGAVLNAKIIPEGTEIEVLQLPLGDGDRPSGPSELSEGRFLVLDPERRDPAALQNRLVTVVGEVAGTAVRKLDEVDYTYPYLSARFIHIWRSAGGYSPAAPYYYPYAPPYYYYPYGPYYPYYYPDPFFWSGSYHHYYYDYEGYGGSSHRPAQRRFEVPAGAGSPPPAGSGSAPPPSGRGGGGGGNGGGGRRFR